MVDAVTYGGAAAARSPLLHLWSLAVEAQFYLAWAVAVVVVLRWRHGRVRALLVLAAAGAVASAALMALSCVPGEDPLRLYYGSDTRSQAFLVGAGAALVAPHTRVRLWFAALPAVLAVVAAFATDAPDVLYRGGFLAVAAATALLVVGAPRSPRCDGCSTLRRCGSSGVCRMPCTCGTGRRSSCSRRRAPVGAVRDCSAPELR